MLAALVAWPAVAVAQEPVTVPVTVPEAGAETEPVTVPVTVPEAGAETEPVTVPETEPEAGAETEAGRASCEEAPAVFDLLCWSYELLKERYVDDVPDEDLAAAAATGVREAGLAPRGEEEEAAPVCALPAPAFEQTCIEIDAVADTAAAVMFASTEMFASLGDPNTFLMSRSEYEALLSRLERGRALLWHRSEPGPAGWHGALPRSVGDVPAGCGRDVCGQPGREGRLMADDIVLSLDDYVPSGSGCGLGGLGSFEPGRLVRVDVERDGRAMSFTVEADLVYVPAAAGRTVGGQDRLSASRLVQRTRRQCSRLGTPNPARFRHRDPGRRPAGQPRGLPADGDQHCQHVSQRPGGRNPGGVQTRHPPARGQRARRSPEPGGCFPSRWRSTSRRPRLRRC